MDGGRATVELIAERKAVQPGELFFAAFDMKLDEGWHVYWRNPGDAGLPPTVEEWSDGAETMIGEFVWPIPHELPVVPGQIMDYGYDDRLVLPFSVTVPDTAAGLISLSGVLGYLICEDICIPEEVPFRLVLPVGDQPVVHEEHGATIASWLEKSAAPFAGQANITERQGGWTLSVSSPPLSSNDLDIRFFPYGDEIVHSAQQNVDFGSEGASVELTPFPGEPFPDSLAGVIVAEAPTGKRQGFVIEALPGPVLPNTSGLGAERAVGSEGVGLLSIALLALAGGLILNFMPCVLPVLAIKALGLVQAATGGDTSELRTHGIYYTLGVVLSFLGIAAGFVALRAGGEFLSIGFQLQYPVGVALLTLLMFTIGLWLLGLFELGTSLQGLGSGLAARGGGSGAFFTGVLAALVGAPCIGPFLGVALGAVISEPAPIVLMVFGLVGFGLALPFLVLSFVPNLHRFLPKPGAWMDTLKQAFAFPMFLTSAWLLSVLGDQAGTSAITWTVTGAVIITFGIWIVQRSRGGSNLLPKALGTAALIAGIGLPVHASLSASPLAAKVEAYAHTTEVETWSPDRIDELMVAGKGAFVDFTASWCATCQLNKATTLKHADVQAALAGKSITFMVADFTNRDDLIAAELQKRGRPGVPMYLLYEPGNDEPTILPQILSKDLIFRLLEEI